MPPIPVHTASPINTATSKNESDQDAQPSPSTNTSSPPTSTSTAVPASKPSHDNLTPRTAAPIFLSADSRYAQAPTTTTPQKPVPFQQQSSGYSAAQPATAAFPAPTGVPQPHTSLSRQPPPTRTTLPLGTTTSDTPPLPQPGATPVPTSATSTSLETSNNLPPPPKAGEVSTLPRSYAPPTSTSTQQPYPSHPTGYVQNPNASAMTPQQQAAQNLAASQEPLFGSSTIGSAVPENATRPSGGLGSVFGGASGGRASGGLVGSTGGNASGRADEGLFSNAAGGGVGGSLGDWGETARKWVSAAGGKLAEVEGEVWKRVNNEK